MMSDRHRIGVPPHGVCSVYHVETLPSTPVSRKDYLKTAYAAFVQAGCGRTDLLLSMD